MGYNILLTGAGFSHNFRLPLAEQVWYQIFNNKKIQSLSKVKRILMEERSYESLYDKVKCDNYYDDERDVFLSVINDIFNERFEGITIESIQDQRMSNIDFSCLRYFIKLFGKTRHTSKTGFVFTTNQDLFLERLFLISQHNSERLISTPYIDNCIYNFKPNLENMYEGQNGIYTKINPLKVHPEYKNLGVMPTREEIDDKKKLQDLHEYSNRLNNPPQYIKLHGSIGWKYKNDPNNFPLVMGKNKEEQINNDPLLDEYFNFFDQVLLEKNSNLLVIGYSFSDKHINSKIAKAISESGLHIHVISPKKIDDFIDELKNNCPRQEKIISDSIKGYYPFVLNQLFPYNSTKDSRYYEEVPIIKTEAWQSLWGNFFVD